MKKKLEYVQPIRDCAVVDNVTSQSWTEQLVNGTQAMSANVNIYRVNTAINAVFVELLSQ